MKSIPLSVLALALVTTPSFAQQSGFADNGMLLPPMTGSTGTGGQYNGAGCGTGVTPANPFLGGNSFAGNMVDIAPSVDMTIECVDVNWSVVESIDVAVWWCPGTVVGNDVNQLGTWQVISTATVTAAGANLPTNVPVTGSPTFLAGQTYGLYIQVVNYATTAGVLSYTNGGPNTYVGTHCSLTTYYGKGDGLTSSTFSPRAWNGNLYTDVVAPPVPTLTLRGTCPGSMTIVATNCTPGGPLLLLYGPAGNSTKPSGVCSGITLSIRRPKVGPILSPDANGDAALSILVPAHLCGLTVQAVDIPTCTTTNAPTIQ